MILVGSILGEMIPVRVSLTLVNASRYERLYCS